MALFADVALVAVVDIVAKLELNEYEALFAVLALFADVAVLALFDVPAVVAKLELNEYEALFADVADVALPATVA